MVNPERTAVVTHNRRFHNGPHDADRLKLNAMPSKPRTNLILFFFTLVSTTAIRLERRVR